MAAHARGVLTLGGVRKLVTGRWAFPPDCSFSHLPSCLYMLLTHGIQHGDCRYKHSSAVLSCYAHVCISRVSLLTRAPLVP